MTSRAEAVQRRFDRATLVAAIATPLVLGALALDPPNGLATALKAVNWALWGAFALEAATMLAVGGDRLRWAREHPTTLAIAVVSVPAFGGLDLFRLARLLRGPAARRAARAATSHDGLRRLALLTMVTIGLGGLLFARVEPGVSVGEGLYWAVVTVATVGYGDVVPTTSAGRVLAVYVILVGVGFVAILTGAIAERFVGQWRERRAGEEGAAAGGGVASAPARSDAAAGGATSPRDDAVLAKLDELGERLAALERAVERRGS